MVDEPAPRSWWREPLLHFALAGMAIFAVERLSQPPEEAPQRAIHLSTGFLQALEREEQQRTGHPPRTAIERASLVARFVRDEALFREAAELGLEQGDIIVRRRLIQKMEFLLRGAIEIPEPTDEDLEALLQSEPERFARAARLSFTHIFFAPQRRDDAPGDAQAVLSTLGDIERAPERGDPFVQGFDLARQDRDGLAGTFGPEFAAALFAAPVGSWSGPVTSAFGVHLVRVQMRQDEAAPTLSQARAPLTRRWRERQQQRAFEQAVEELVARHPVIRDDDEAS